jgi:hypothetical protein
VLVYVCLSTHGYGHGARQAAILTELARLRPSWRLVVSSALPETFLDLALAEVAHERRDCRWDVGVVQRDALDADAEATETALRELEGQLPDRLAAEAGWIRRQEEPVLVVGDVAPAAAALARRLRAPLAWVANFGWDDIYRPMGGALARRATALWRAYGRGALLLRCPFSLAMAWGVPERTLGLTAARPRLERHALLARLGWRHSPPRDRVVLVSFGGIGLPLDPAAPARWPDHRILMCGVGTDSGSGPGAEMPQVQRLPADLRPVDVMPLVGRLITKPGYSSFCEAMAQDVGLVVVQRRGFAEVDALDQGMRRHSRHRSLTPTALQRGEWRLDEPLLPPEAAPLPGNGAATAALALAHLAERHHETSDQGC